MCCNTEDGALDCEPPNRFRQPIVMREDDDLPCARGFFERAGQAIDASGIHGLHGIVDDDEAEWTLIQSRPWKEQAQRERMQLALTHDAERGAGNAVDGHVERDTPLTFRSDELDPSESDITLLSQVFPRRHR